MNPLNLPRETINGVECVVLELGNNSIEKHNTCPRLYEYYKIQNREPVADVHSRSFGDCLHKALYVKYLNLSSYSVEDMKEAFDQSFRTLTVPKDDHRTLQHGHALIDLHEQSYADDRRRWRVVQAQSGPMVEVKFRHFMFVITPDDHRVRTMPSFAIYLTGIIDLFTEVLDGDVGHWIVDHKSTSRLTTNFLDSFYMNGQMHGYVHYARQSHPSLNIRGHIVNAICTRGVTRYGKGPEVHRRHYPVTEEKLEEWLKNTKYHIISMIRHMGDGYFPQNTNSCDGKYGRCGYFDLCMIRPGLRRAMLDTDTLFRPVSRPSFGGGNAIPIILD